MADSLDGALSSSTFSMQRRFQSRPPLCFLRRQPPAATTTLLPSPSPVAARQSSSGKAEQRQERTSARTAATGIDTSSSPVLCARNSSESKLSLPRRIDRFDDGVSAAGPHALQEAQELAQEECYSWELDPGSPEIPPHKESSLAT
nr:hypothetical protein Iba_chr06bCG8270 [Ipomoea batatas]